MNNWKGQFLTGSSGAINLGATTKKNDDFDYNSFNQNPNKHLLAERSLPTNNKSKEKNLLLTNLELEKRKKNLKSKDKKNLIYKIYPRKNEDIKIEDDPSKIDQFNFETEKVIRELSTLNNSWSKRLITLISEIIPRTSSNPETLRENGTGLSTHYYRKGVFLSLPKKKHNLQIELLLNLVHEMGHQALINYQKQDKIIKSPHDESIFSVVRKTNRPAILSFHAMVATMYMTELIATSYEKLLELATPEYLKVRFHGLIKDLKDSIKHLEKLEFTQLGQNMMNESRALYIFSSMRYENV